MARPKTATGVRLTLGFFFLLFLLFNAIFQTLAVIAGLNHQEPIRLLPEDLSPGVRLLIFLIGIVVSWLLGRTLFKSLIHARVEVSDSTNIAYVLLFYLLLVMATFAFFSVVGWFWLPALFLILLIYSLVALWRVIGGVVAGCALALMLIVVACTYYVAG